MNDKKILIEEVQRMRSMMGLKENYIPKVLLNEGPGDLWGMVKAFIEANDTARAGLINRIKGDPAQKRLFDELLDKYKSIIDPTNSIRSIDDLTDATRQLQLTAFANRLANDLGDIEKTIGRYGINYATDYAKLASFNAAAAGSQKQAVLQTVKNTNPLVGDVLSKLEANQIDQIEISEIQTVYNNASDLLARETDPDLKQFYQDLVDDLDVAFNHRLELQNIADEKGNFGSISDAARGADEAGDDAARGADDTGGRTYSMPDVEEVALDQTIDGIRSRLYSTVDNVQLKQIYATLVSDIKTSKVKFPFNNNNLALFKEMEQRGLLKEDDLIGNILVGNITANPDVIKMQELVAEYNDYVKAFKKNPVMYMGRDGVMKQSVPEDLVDWSIKYKKTLPSNVNKQKLLGKGLEYLNDIFVWPFTRLVGKNTEKGSFSTAVLRLLMGFGGGVALTWRALSAAKTVGQGGIDFVKETPMAQKTTIKEGVKTYFSYDNPQLIIDGKAENIYAQGIDKTRASNLNLKNAAPVITFDLDVKQRQFSLNPGIVINGKKYTSFIINFGEGNFVTQGEEFFDNKNVLVAITQTTPSTETYTNDLKGFQAWCKTKGYTDCTYVGGKWEYKDKSGADQQGKYVDTASGWGN
jgi:hypothetical protein